MFTNDHLITQHLAHLRYLNYAQQTIYQRHRVLLRLLLSAGVEFAEVTEVEVRARLDTIDSPAGRACELSHVRGFYQWAIEYDMLDADPTRRLRRPKLPRGLPRPISEEDLRSAMLDAPARIRPWFLLAGWAGLRCCEIATLRAEDLMTDAAPPILMVRSGKGNADGAVPMSEWLVDEMRRCNLPRTGYLFRRHDGQPGHIQPHSVSHLAADYMRSVGVDATIHQLRHRFGTQVHRRHRDMRVTQELLRHRSLNSTAIYTWVAPSDTYSAVQSLPTTGDAA